MAAKEIFGIICGIIAVFLLVLPSIQKSRQAKKPKVEAEPEPEPKVEAKPQKAIWHTGIG